MGARFILHAANVHQGGGKALLDALLQALSGQGECVLLLDARMPVPSGMMDNHRIMRIYPSVFHRFRAERWLAQHVRTSDTVLCFGNLPTIFKVAGHEIVFVQNRYLLQQGSLAGFSWKTKLRLSVERRWFKWRAINADQFIVQTPAMKAALDKWFGSHWAKHKEKTGEGSRVSIRILPFVNAPEGYQRERPIRPQNGKWDYDFFYVASGEPHKNHRRLIEAWCLLAKENCFPSLVLTVDEASFPELCEWMRDKKARCNLQLENLGALTHDEVKRMYKRVGAMVYPSVFESFGIPLIEARQAGLPVLAAELDYVRDVLDPEQTFDPESVVSLARAVKRFLGVEEAPLPLQNAGEFIRHVWGGLGGTE